MSNFFTPVGDDNSLKRNADWEAQVKCCESIF